MVENSVVAAAGVLRSLEVPADDAARIDLIRALEELTSAAAAAKARVTAAFVESQRAEQAAAGVPSDQIGRGVAAQVALARRISPYAAQRYVGWARALTSDLPETLAALQAGRTSEWRAMLVARETGWLSPHHRREVDRQLAAGLASMGDRQVANEARRLAQRLDQAAAVEKLRYAQGERRVTIQPAPDTMCWLTALLPVAQGVAAYAALTRYADAHAGVGEESRSRGQLMADALVERLTGQASAGSVPVEIQLVMGEAALLRGPDAPGYDEPAWIAGYGPVPADVARTLALNGGARGAPRWLRRLYQAPEGGELVAMDSRRRRFTPEQRRFVRARDQFCRTPWCNAPVRHIDHVQAHEDGGPTSIDNAQGLCEACNHAKQARGWRAWISNGEVIITTPTGRTYRSRAPTLIAPAVPIMYSGHRAA